MDYQLTQPIYPFWNNNYLNAYVKSSIDMGYQTTYYAYEDTTTGRHYESYGVQGYSWLNLTLNVEWFQYYSQQIMLSVVPFTIVPYQQEWYFVRPITKMRFTMGVRAWRKVTLAKVLTTYTENAKSCAWSLLDQMRGAATWTWDSSNCNYDMTQQVNYEDAYWNYDYLAKYYSTSNWYGTQYYFDQSFF